MLHALDTQQALELLLDRMKKTKSNAEFLMQVQKTMPMPGNARRRTAPGRGTDARSGRTRPRLPTSRNSGSPLARL